MKHDSAWLFMNHKFGAGYLQGILKKNNLYPNRTLGQNFLVSPEFFMKLISAVDLHPCDMVLEVGTGIGRLTALISDRADKVVSVEVDSGLFRVASKRLSARKNVTLLHRDILAGKHKIDRAVLNSIDGVAGADRGIKVVGNLPYQISSPAIINFLELDRPVKAIYVMLQQEVAQRLVADPGSSAYGPISVFARYLAAVRLHFSVPASAFWPMPAVTSAFVELTLRRPAKEAKDYVLFTRLVNTVFQSRRKMLRKSLKMGWGKEAAGAAIEKAEINPQIRAEELSPEQLVCLSNHLLDIIKGAV